MPGKKLTARKRAELKEKKRKEMQRGNFPVLIILFIIIVGVIAGGYYVITNLDGSENGQNTNGQANSAPVATMDYVVIPVNANFYRIEPLENDYDLDNDELNITSVTNPEYGTVEIMEENILKYTPTENYDDLFSFKYTISDGKKETTSTINLIMAQDNNPIALIDTSKGMIITELFFDKVPNTVINFIDLAKADFYDGLVFHRVIDDFMIQGGGFEQDGSRKESPFGTIDLEINEEVRHVDGAIAMARTNEPNSATSQFYICDGAQSYLDDDYAAFGVVIYGMDIVRSIASVETTTKYGMQDWPVKNVIIESIEIGNIGIE
jgi:cyclophilin family peptidyl-prolyl cis-trans isomerase